MKKQEFINELKKRIKYVGDIKETDNFFNALKRYRVQVAMVDTIDQKEVHRDTIFFWIRNNPPRQELLDLRWEGNCYQIDKEIEEIIAGQGIYSKNEKAERRKNRERILEGEEDRDEDSKTWGR